MRLSELEPGTKLDLETNEATYCPCEVVNSSDNAVTVKFHNGNKMDKRTREWFADWRTEAIRRADIKRCRVIS